MQIFSILPVIEGKLFRTVYDRSGENILDTLQDNWSDTLWLYAFFKQFQKDLQSGIYRPISLKEAVKITIKESDRLFERLYKNDGENLDDLFRPLDNREPEVQDFQDQKAYGDRRKSWLRLYAVHCYGRYIVTGGAIKLTKTMNTRPHLKKELYKLSLVREKLALDHEAGTLGYLEL